MTLTTILPVIFGALSLICALIARFIELDSWNQGHCKCGGEWIQFKKENFSREYDCNQCGKTITVISNIDKEWK